MVDLFPFPLCNSTTITLIWLLAHLIMPQNTKMHISLNNYFDNMYRANQNHKSRIHYYPTLIFSHLNHVLPPITSTLSFFIAEKGYTTILFFSFSSSSSFLSLKP
ncbi:hypothetical protein RJT34_03300 [Clitoria ternatea]|uniref:Uncharacterized protein n=1 Tax=Clitoria ternatea TaxID=43366 RepID=A0AAN9KJK1_CLITE